MFITSEIIHVFLYEYRLRYTYYPIKGIFYYPQKSMMDYTKDLEEFNYLFEFLVYNIQTNLS